jgi:hypothetical protein
VDKMMNNDAVRRQYDKNMKSLYGEVEKSTADATELKSIGIEPVSSPSGRVKGKKALETNKRNIAFQLNYPGCVIAENNCYEGFGRNRHMKPEAKAWSDELIWTIRRCGVENWKAPLKVTISGVFKNKQRCPDLQNMKLVYDSIQTVTGLNDKFFATETIPPVINPEETPHLNIKIEEI